MTWITEAANGGQIDTEQKSEYNQNMTLLGQSGAPGELPRLGHLIEGTEMENQKNELLTATIEEQPNEGLIFSDGIGRPTIINEEIIQTLGEAIRAGVPKHRAAPLAGISIRTFHYWMARANEILDRMEEERDQGIDVMVTGEELLYLQLLQTVQLAESKLMQEGIERIKAEGPSGYKWLLPKLFRKEFGDHLTLIPGEGEDEPRQLVLELPGLMDEPTEE